jgi:hypothetical protein
LQQETPSFNAFQNTVTGEWRFKDFATGDEGSCFDLVMKLFNLSFPEALEKIQDDFKFDVAKQPFQLSKAHELQVKDYQIRKRPFNKEELDFWVKFGIDEHIKNITFHLYMNLVLLVKQGMTIL